MKIKAVKTRDLRKELLSLGFEEEAGRDHIFYFYRHGGKIVVRTKVSHGLDEIRQPILGLIVKQLQMNRDEFEDLLNRKLSTERYKRILIERGIIE
jgi:predicted RNA binding protein YcfA (HicA-like mRNA interferase family)